MENHLQALAAEIDLKKYHHSYLSRVSVFSKALRTQTLLDHSIARVHVLTSLDLRRALKIAAAAEDQARPDLLLLLLLLLHHHYYHQVMYHLLLPTITLQVMLPCLCLCFHHPRSGRWSCSLHAECRCGSRTRRVG